MFDFGIINEEQKQVVLNCEGPVLVIAGPGTGKTFTIVKRIAYLVKEKRVKPEEIMVVTFTEKAAKELITRIANEFIDMEADINIHDMYIGTFHSVCLRILKEFDSKAAEDCEIADSFRQVYFVCRNIDSFRTFKDYKRLITGSSDWEQAQEICKYVNNVMEERTDIRALEECPDEDVRFLGKIVSKYREMFKRAGLMDFSAIQTMTLEMLDNNPEILRELNDRIKYIMADEYQDTNHIQEQLLDRLAGARKNLCVVGDDDQGMYRFRGATIRNILEFPSKFEKDKCRIIHLNRNYRSEPDIIRHYSRWMENADGINLFNWDKYRFSKNITAASDNVTNEKAVFACGGTEESEHKDIFELINYLKENGAITDYNQVVLLFKSVKGSEAKGLANFLEEKGIPVYSPRSEMFFERDEIKQIIGCLIRCFLSYAVGLKKNEYAISSELRNYYKVCIKASEEIIKTSPELAAYIQNTATEIKELKEESGTDLSGIFYRLIAFMPFRKYIDISMKENAVRLRAARNLATFSVILSDFSRLHNMYDISGKNKTAMACELFNVYIKYLYIDGIGEYEDAAEFAPNGCISFMTIHQSKGLEFPVVIVGSMNSKPKKQTNLLMQSVENYMGRTPYEPLADIKYFDFWRLYYTAFSRAKNLLVLSFRSSKSKYFETYRERLPHTSQYSVKKPFADVESKSFKRVYSFTSHIAVYEDCPTQYKYFKELGFARRRIHHTSVGSLIHASFENMNKRIIEGRDVNETEIKEQFRLNYETVRRETGCILSEEEYENALSQVIRYYRGNKATFGKVWKSEEEIRLVHKDFILQGIVDLIERDGDSLKIIDYKTGPKPDLSRNPERISHYRRQLEIYSYLVERQFGIKVGSMYLCYTSSSENPYIKLERKREDVEGMLEEITETIKKIENKDFEEKAKHSFACEYCAMKYVCKNSF